MRFTSITAILGLVGKPKRDCDFYDKLNHRYVSYFLITLGLMFFVREYVGSPIHCWGKPQWIGSWVQYAEDYCLVEGTYFLSLNKAYNNHESKSKNKVNFYQVRDIFQTILLFKLSVASIYLLFLGNAHDVTKKILGYR